LACCVFVNQAAKAQTSRYSLARMTSVRFETAGFLASAAIVTVIAVCATPAFAYRPFDGTDAAVADFGEVELELQPMGVLRSNGQNTPAGPYAVFNYGFAERWELVLQAAAEAPPGGAGPTSVPNGAFLKYVIQPGVLQDKPGPSVATEFGPLLPDVGGSGLGVSWTAIVSQRWDWGTVHWNVETNLTPDQHGELFLDAIIEGPISWKVRPVVELYADRVFNQSQTFSALVGAIWQAQDNLAFDLAVRAALVNNHPVNELRAGLTVALPVNFSKAASTATGPAFGRSH
jgi:hypothetical protein